MLEFSEHAHFAASEREIPIEWVERVVKTPELCLQDPRDAEQHRFYGPIQEFGNRVLRVVVNTKAAPWRVVSVFFDRSMKGKL